MRISKEKSNKEVLGKEVLSRETLGKDVLNKDVLNKEDRVQKQRSLSVIDSFIGKDISIVLRGGNKLEGKLESVAQYEIIVTISHSPVIIMKHAIDYIGLVGEK